MKNSHYKLIFGALTTFAAIASSPAQANFTWTYNGSPCALGPCTATDGSTSITATSTAYKAQSTNSVLSTTTKAYFGPSYGLGAGGEPSPEHAVDNIAGYEGMLFSFNKAVDLTSITMGWHKDADFSLLRYTGAPSSTPLNGLTYNNMDSNGWELVGNYTFWSDGSASSGDITASVYGDKPDDYAGPKDKNGNTLLSTPAHTSSSHWLIAATNGAFWNNYSDIDDYFKIHQLVATYAPPPTTGAPEPSTLALMSVAFAGFAFTRRKRKEQLS